MSKRKEGFSMEQHRQTGAQLREMRNELVPLVVEVGNSYPVSGKRGRIFARLKKALNALDEARSLLEDEMSNEYALDEWDLATYYR